MFKKISEAVDFIRKRISSAPEAGIVLGTGLGSLVEEIENPVVIPYLEIPHFPVSTVEGHAGELISGLLNNRQIIAMRGRFHIYEGYSMDDVVFSVRVMKLLGIRLLILSNASGGLNPDFQTGDMMFVTDHINLMNLMKENLLRGMQYDEVGLQFSEMKHIYSPEIINKAEEIASRLGIRYRKGVYAGVTGPSYETPSEYRNLRFSGADAVGMSTIPEAILASELSLSVFAISVISNLGVRGKNVKITHKDVIDAASLVEPSMTLLIKTLLREVRL